MNISDAASPSEAAQRMLDRAKASGTIRVVESWKSPEQRVKERGKVEKTAFEPLRKRVKQYGPRHKTAP